LDSSESLRKFQAGLLPSKDEEWHVLVPDAAREALGKHEVERQSVLFEIFKAERDYVGDLVLVQEVRMTFLLDVFLWILFLSCFYVMILILIMIIFEIRPSDRLVGLIRSIINFRAAVRAFDFTCRVPLHVFLFKVLQPMDGAF
jgi:hypothetical protein